MRAWARPASPDDAVLSLLVTVDGDALDWSGISDGVAFGSIAVMLRQPTMTRWGP